MLLSLVFLGVVPHVFADGFVPLAPIPGLTDASTVGSVVNADTLATFFNNLYKYLIGIAATLAVIEIIWGGLEISTKDSVSKHSDGVERIQQAIFGLVLVLSPVLVFSIINPSILNLSLNLPPINLTTTPTVSGSGTGDTTAAKAAGCSAALSNGTVGCPTQAAADAFLSSCSNGGTGGSVFLSNDSSLPYSASCNPVSPNSQIAQNYKDPAQIPKGLWCYKAQVYNADKTTNYLYVCGADKPSCDGLAISNTSGGTILSDCSPH